MLKTRYSIAAATTTALLSVGLISSAWTSAPAASNIAARAHMTSAATTHSSQYDQNPVWGVLSDTANTKTTVVQSNVQISGTIYSEGKLPDGSWGAYLVPDQAFKHSPYMLGMNAATDEIWMQASAPVSLANGTHVIVTGSLTNSTVYNPAIANHPVVWSYAELASVSGIQATSTAAQASIAAPSGWQTSVQANAATEASRLQSFMGQVAGKPGSSTDSASYQSALKTLQADVQLLQGEKTASGSQLQQIANDVVAFTLAANANGSATGAP
ncbi:MAG: hypothetical protein ACYCVB_04160 [Bacilli bacterium]